MCCSEVKDLLSSFPDRRHHQLELFYRMHFCAVTTRGCYNFTPAPFSSCRPHIRPGGPAEIQHGVHPVHARGPQHAPHLRLDGQNSGLPSPQPPPQVPAQVHRWAPPPAHTQTGGPSSCQSRDEAPRHNPQSRPREAAPERRAHLPCGWSPRETGTPKLPAWNARDVEALVNWWIDDLGCLFLLDHPLLCIL